MLRTVTTADGVALRSVRWDVPAGDGPAGGVNHEGARGTVLLLQGRAEFVEKYFEVVGELRARGFAVVAFDWRGQGESGRALRQGHKGHVASFVDFERDLDAVAAATLPGCPRPVVALAHSMGGCIALAVASDGRLPADRLVALAPMVGLTLVRRNGLVRRLARALHGLGLGPWVVPGGSARSISTLPFAGNRLSGDPARYARNAAVAGALGAAAIGAPTIGWLHAAYGAMARLSGPGRPAIPTLVVTAGDDPVCSAAAARSYAEALGPGGVLDIPGARHEILMETDAIRDAFWAAFDRFAGASATDEPSPDASAGRQAREREVVQPRIA